MSRYTSGVAKERDAKQHLLESGALLVVRAAGSKGLVDLVAVWPRAVWLVQVKYTGRGGQAWRDRNWRKLLALDLPANAHPLAYVYRRGVRSPERYGR